jgi:3-oxoacyl-[acyl-carrier protein] reductase
VDLGLRGKAVLVTGSASGIGAETAAQFASEGAKVVVADINADAADLVARRLREAGGAAIGVAADVTIAASVAQMIEYMLKSFGRLDVVVNNAGFTRDMRIGRMPEEAWDAVVDVVLKGAFLVSKEAVPHLREGGIGRLGAPGDVASAILFLASAQAGYITGEVLHVTGGRY